MKKISAFALCSSLFSGLLSFAAAYETDTLYHGDTVTPTSLAEVVQTVAPGSVVIVSEIHDQWAHHHKQRDFLHALSTRIENISVGMEFFPYTYQAQVDLYFNARLDEETFLRDLRWTGQDFAMYRDLVKFPAQSNGQCLALNSPKEVTSYTARHGIDALPVPLRELLPPDFTVGNAGYRQRFSDLMGGNHIPPQSLERYFTAQSIWDDTMAWQAREFLHKHPEQVLVIVVGDFHAAYGGGLPDRLRARGQDKLVVISQVSFNGLSQGEINTLMTPHPSFGPRADFIWTSP